MIGASKSSRHKYYNLFGKVAIKVSLWSFFVNKQNLNGAFSHIPAASCQTAEQYEPEATVDEQTTLKVLL